MIQRGFPLPPAYCAALWACVSGTDAGVDGSPDVDTDCDTDTACDEPCFDGEWVREAPPVTNSDIEAVWVIAADDVVFVGNRGVVLRYQGSSWTENKVEGIASFHGIWGSGPDDLFAVGIPEEGSSPIRHWDGTTWSAMEFEPGRTLHGVFGLAPDRVWAVGNGGLIAHYDGETWSWMAPFPSYYLVDVFAADPDDIVVVGYEAVGSWKGGTTGAGPSYRASIFHFDGEDWTAAWTRYLAILQAVHGASDGRVLAVGRHFGMDSGLGGLVLERSAQGWVETAVAEVGGFSSVWAAQDGNTLVVAQRRSASEGNPVEIRKLEGGLWAPVTIAGWVGNGVITIGGAGDHLFAAGRAGALLRLEGDVWRSLNGPTNSRIHALRTIAPGVRVGVGEAGLVLRDTGSGLEIEPNPSHKTLRTMWAGGPDDIWAGGEGTMLHYDGNGWSEDLDFIADVGDHFSVSGLWGSGPNDVWATCHQGELLRYDGTGWNRMAYPLSDTVFTPSLNGVWGSGPDDVYIFGNTQTMSNGLILRWNGVGWTTEQVPYGSYVSAVAGCGPLDVHAHARDVVSSAGTCGFIRREPSGIWTESLGTPNIRILDMIGFDTGELFAPGRAIYTSEHRFYEWDGFSWSAVPGDWRDVWGVDGATLQDLCALGSGGTIRCRTSCPP